MLKKLEEKEKLEEVIKDGLWLVDFSATWCGPCRMLEPILEEFGKDNNILQIDVDLFSDLAASYGIMSVPTLIAFKDGKEIKKSIGLIDLKQIEEMFK